MLRHRIIQVSFTVILILRRQLHETKTSAMQYELMQARCEGLQVARES